MTAQKMNDLLNELGTLLGLEDLALNENNCCFLSFDDTYVTIEHDPVTSHTVLFSPIGGIPKENREEFYITLLDGNFFWQSTSGATLSIDREEELVYLFYDFEPKHTSFSQFQNVLENFVAVAEEWTGKTNSFSVEVEPDSIKSEPENAIKV
jgi:Tir chaperone protein (CesT) family